MCVYMCMWVWGGVYGGNRDTKTKMSLPWLWFKMFTDKKLEFWVI